MTSNKGVVSRGAQAVAGEKNAKAAKTTSDSDTATDERSAQISFDDFMKVDIRVGTIVEALEFPQARKPAYKLRIDFGPEIGIKKSSAQITANYTLNDLVGRQVCAVVNFPPRQIGPLMSQVLTLGMPDEAGEVMLVEPSNKIPNGGRLY